jgi:hypothetical protein
METYTPPEVDDYRGRRVQGQMVDDFHGKWVLLSEVQELKQDVVNLIAEGKDPMEAFDDWGI